MSNGKKKSKQSSISGKIGGVSTLIIKKQHIVIHMITYTEANPQRVHCKTENLVSQWWETDSEHELAFTLTRFVKISYFLRAYPAVIKK